MKRNPPPPLSHEDRILWNRVARSTVPMPGRTVEEPSREIADFEALLAGRQPVATPAPAASASTRAEPSQAGHQHRLDAPTRGKLARGRLPIEGKVDLHGLTQGEAHGLLLSFLHRARADGRRHVLVVTGKGSSLGSEGVLRRAVPAWLATAPFRALVSGYEVAARGHGGAGALYVRLRKPASS